MSSLGYEILHDWFGFANWQFDPVAKAYKAFVYGAVATRKLGEYYAPQQHVKMRFLYTNGKINLEYAGKVKEMRLEDRDPHTSIPFGTLIEAFQNDIVNNTYRYPILQNKFRSTIYLDQFLECFPDIELEEPQEASEFPLQIRLEIEEIQPKTIKVTYLWANEAREFIINNMDYQDVEAMVEPYPLIDEPPPVTGTYPAPSDEKKTTIRRAIYQTFEGVEVELPGTNYFS